MMVPSQSEVKVPITIMALHCSAKHFILKHILTALYSKEQNYFSIWNSLQRIHFRS